MSDEWSVEEETWNDDEWSEISEGETQRHGFLLS